MPEKIYRLALARTDIERGRIVFFYLCTFFYYYYYSTDYFLTVLMLTNGCCIDVSSIDVRCNSQHLGVLIVPGGQKTRLSAFFLATFLLGMA